MLKLLPSENFRSRGALSVLLGLLWRHLSLCKDALEWRAVGDRPDDRKCDAAEAAAERAAQEFGKRPRDVVRIVLEDTTPPCTEHEGVGHRMIRALYQKIARDGVITMIDLLVKEARP